MVNEISLFPVCVGRQHEQQWVAWLTAALLHVTAAIVQISDSLMCLTFILLPTDSFLFVCFLLIAFYFVPCHCNASHCAAGHCMLRHCTTLHFIARHRIIAS